jgi:hypothetical protein
MLIGMSKTFWASTEHTKSLFQANKCDIILYGKKIPYEEGE